MTVESLQKILTKRRSQTFYKPTDVHSVTNIVSEVSMILLVVRFFWWVGSKKFKGRKTFSNQMNRNRFVLIPRWRDRNCCSMKKLRCPNSAVNEMF